MKLKALVLSPEDRSGLEKVVNKGSDWRMRHRAQTLLYFGDGWRAKEIAAAQELHLDTVYDRRKHWMDEGFESLADKHRCGVASKVSVAQREQLRQWASAEPLTARQLVTRLKEEFDISIHPNTLGVILKQMKFVWKRTRHSLKKSEMHANSPSPR
jgi:transposase